MWTFEIFNDIAFAARIDLYYKDKFTHISSKPYRGSKEQLWFIGMEKCAELNFSKLTPETLEL